MAVLSQLAAQPREAAHEHDRILRTVLRHVPDALVPGTRPEDRQPRRQHGHVGAPVSRVDGALKVRGAARFAAEVPMEGLLYAALVHSTIARGRIARIDTAAAEAAPGVVLVMTHATRRG